MNNEDLKRLLALKEADNGFYVLGMHSLIEKELRDFLKIPDDSRNRELTFEMLFQNWLDIISKGRNIPYFKTLINVKYNDHFLTNNVRHRFGKIGEYEAKVATCGFVNVAKEMGNENLSGIQQLKLILNDWENHRSESDKQLAKLTQELKNLQAENSNLVEKANQVLDLENQLKNLNAHLKAVESDLEQSKKRVQQQSEKNDAARKEKFEMQSEYKKKIKEITDKLNEYEDTQKYLDYMTNIAYYTRTRHDYEQSIINLTEEQESVLNSIDMEKDFLIKGSAGTGKSYVLLKTLETAIKKNQKKFKNGDIKFKLLTYTKSLVKYNTYVSSLMEMEVPDGTITTADSFVAYLLNIFCNGKKIDFDSNVYNYNLDFENNFMSIKDYSFDWSEVFSEAQNFIWPNLVTKKEYLDGIERTGMGKAMSISNRKKLWAQLEELEEKFENENVWPKFYALKKINEKLNSGEDDVDSKIENNSVDFAFIDEAQDLQPSVLSAIKRLTKKGVFLCGDSDQSIYTRGFSFNRSGIKVSGRTRILKTNFRNTQQIHEFAENYRAKLDTKDTSLKPKAFRSGPPVEISKGKDTNSLFNMMIEKIKLLIDGLHYECENICIILPTKQKLEKIKSLIKSELDLDAINISDADFDFKTTPGIKLTTMHSCKGLDFPVVFVLADHRPAAFVQNGQNQIWDDETLETQLRNALYVSLTRAMEMLHIFRLENPNSQAYRDLDF